MVVRRHLWAKLVQDIRSLIWTDLPQLKRRHNSMDLHVLVLQNILMGDWWENDPLVQVLH